MFDFVTSLARIIRWKPVTFVLDVLMMCSFALSFFSLLIGYNSGEIRVLILLFSLAGLTAYLMTVHRVFVHLFDKMLKFLRRRLKNLSICLKKFKKS